MKRILIAGGPRTGKTTLAATWAESLGVTARSTDELIGRLDWSAASAEVATWFDAAGPWVIEGVAVPRALRKWLARTGAKPADRIIRLTRPMTFRSSGQITMAKGCDKVWTEILPALRRAGVEIVEQ